MRASGARQHLSFHQPVRDGHFLARETVSLAAKQRRLIDGHQLNRRGMAQVFGESNAEVVETALRVRKRSRHWKA